MQHRAVFRWTFAAAGLWLMLSPFLLFATQAANSDPIIGEASLMIVSGLLASVVAARDARSFRADGHVIECGLL